MRKPHLIIEANAGAAKTTTLALRLAQALLRGADPQRVRVLTYTDAAVQAFSDAMARIGLAADVRRQVRVQTFDAFCTERLLAIEGAPVPLLDKAELLRPHVLAAIDRVLHNADERHPRRVHLRRPQRGQRRRPAVGLPSPQGHDAAAGGSV